MAVKTFTLPDLGEGLTEAEIVEWHVSEGDRVVADQPLVTVETDKAVVEVPSPWSGTVSVLRARPGDVLTIGAPMADINGEARTDQGAVVGKIEPAPAREAGKPAVKPTEARRKRKMLHAVPAARARARELGVTLDRIEGTGPGGAISLADVEAAAAGGDAVASTQGPGAKRAMARKMARAHAEVVPATLTDIADITGWFTPGAEIMVRLIRAVCAAATVEPALATWYDPDGVHSEIPGELSIGFAVDTSQGLYVPVLHDAAALSGSELRARIDALIAKTRHRQLGRGEQRNPMITLSNFGPLGGRHASLVVMPPQVAILGVGRAYEAVAWKDDAPAREMALPLSLTFDHRAATGGEAARFLAAVIADLERTEMPEAP